MPVNELYFTMISLFGMGVIFSGFGKISPKAANIVAHSLAAMGCLVAISLSVAIFIGGSHLMHIGFPPPFGEVAVRIDNLASFFLLSFGVVGLAASVYAIGYAAEYYGRRFSQMAALYNLFLLSIVLVLTVGQVFAFIVVWELMTVVSFFLVNHEYEKTNNTSAAYLYILMTHIGTAFISIAFLLMAGSVNSLDFSALRADGMTETLRNAVFICALIGFGTKAGIIPLHIWLPEAHPAAPSHVSALMSGIMIKTAIYGMSRFFLEFLGVGPQWWGHLVLGLAIVSSVLGVLYALMEHDLKRLLAYHSVENIGIILLGMGAGMVCMSKGMPVLAGVAWIASLYHVFNHAVFKSLLFLGAGAVAHATHTKDMEQLGGIIKKMPYTALFFLIGAAAISGLPPLNGFVSEWLTFQSLFLLTKAVTGFIGKFWSVILIALLGLTGALAATCFVKAFGVTFLAKPRSENAAKAQEVSGTMLAGMGFLSLMCIASGVWPQWMLRILEGVVSECAGGKMAGSLNSSQWYAMALNGSQAEATLSMPGVVGLIIAGLVVAIGFARFSGIPRREMGETWTCGIIPDARMSYTATGFAQPIRRVFSNVLNPVEELHADQSINPYHGVKMTLHVRVTHYINEMAYKPLCEGAMWLSGCVKAIQAGSLQLYIGYIMAITVVVLAIGTRW